jgi:hypothetical protein
MARGHIGAPNDDEMRGQSCSTVGESCNCEPVVINDSPVKAVCQLNHTWGTFDSNGCPPLFVQDGDGCVGGSMYCVSDELGRVHCYCRANTQTYQCVPPDLAFGDI